MKRTKPIIASERKYDTFRKKDIPVSSYFGEDTFNYAIIAKNFVVLEKMLKTFIHGLSGAAGHGLKLK